MEEREKERGRAACPTWRRFSCLSFSLAAAPTKRLNHQRIEEGGREGGRLDAAPPVRCLAVKHGQRTCFDTLHLSYLSTQTRNIGASATATTASSLGVVEGLSLSLSLTLL